VIKAETPRPHRPGVLPESSAPAVVSMVARFSHERAERLQAVAQGTADLIVCTPLCPPQNFVTTPSPRVGGSKAVSGPCRIMRVEVAGGRPAWPEERARGILPLAVMDKCIPNSVEFLPRMP
jgi:hypothetical protein